MSRKLLPALVAIALVALLVSVYFGGHTPPGQPPLQKLMAQNRSSIADAFNAATGDVRLVLLLSPT